MPLPEINLSHYIRALIRLNESTAEQVGQYATFVHASADDVVDKALNYVFSKGRDFQDFLKTAQAQHVAATLRVHRASSKDAKDAPELPAKKLTAGGSPGLQRGRRSRDRAFNTVLGQERCCAPEELWTRHPQFGNCGAPDETSAFTQVNFRCVNKIRQLLRD